jgi:hypothetical protein
MLQMPSVNGRRELWKFSTQGQNKLYLSLDHAKQTES